MPQQTRFRYHVVRKPPARPGLAAPSLCLALLLTLAACELFSPGVALPADAVPMTAPPVYRQWWVDTEGCSGLAGNYARVQWYVVPGATSFMTGDGEKVGLWSSSSEGVRIVVAGEYREHELVVRHEMLHALLDREGHPSEFFTNRCHLTWETWEQRT